MIPSKHFLVCPLEWGLGHAARCIPIIRTLLDQNHRVTIAADGTPADLLREEFPNLPLVRLLGYGIRYPASGNMAMAMALQMPKLLAGAIREHVRLGQLIRDLAIDTVISDSRFGLFNKHVQSIYITHQLTIKFPRGLSLFEPLLARFHRTLIERYDECWIPDLPDEPNLAGELSHPRRLPSNAKFIGPLSRMSREAAPGESCNLLIVLSGPEPQRTIFEKTILAQVSQAVDLKIILIRGVTGKPSEWQKQGNVKLCSYLTSGQLNRLMLSAKMILTRPGYSTIMDLAALGKKAILIPTPGQTEQEYLATRLKKKMIFYSEPQKEFGLSRCLRAAKDYSGITLHDGND